MKTINICGGRSCCPRLVIERTGRKLRFYIVDDDGTTIILDSEIARNLALTIFEEVGKI